MKKDLIITRVVAAVLAFAMFATQLSETMPVFYVCAEGEAETEYSIEHKVNSSWDGGCNAEFILKNLSNTGTKDWSISFSTTDEITDIWGGTITECREVSDENTTTGLEHYYRYTVKAESYTASIPSGAQVNIGYTALGDIHDIWDTEAEIVSDDTEAGSGSNGEGDTTPIGGTYIGEGYTIDVIVADTWEGAYNVKLQIRNTSGKKVHNWGLIMKTTDRISGLYNAVELSDNDGLRLIKNAGYDQDIPAGGSVEIGYTAFYEGKADVPKEFALSQVKKEADMAECAVSLFITDEWEEGGMAQIIIENISDSPIEDWSLEFDSTMDIANLWGGVIEKHEAGHYCIGNADYAQNIAVGESWAITIVFNGKAADIQNIKVSQIVVVDGNLPDMPTPSPDEEEDIDLETDTDEDGIPDAYEEMIGTDPTDKDTDNDGLDDYIEVFVTGSDPLVYDSIEQGVADSDADPDGDSISNIDEITLGLDPSRRDTDHDGLDDDEEMYVYGTDPADPDTDDDGLKDGDEIKLGLDPMDPATNGVSDAEYRISQTIDADSDVLRQINTDDNGYRFSADIKTAGYVEGNIRAAESDHAYVMQNDAMLGKALQLKYDMDSTVDEVTLHFEIDDRYIPGESMLYPEVEELKGIHRYNVFHYFEDRNMLLPVETFFDDENNAVYAKTDELGTYCLMDMEKVFDRLNSLSEMETEKDDISGISIPEISQQAETAETQMTALEFAKEMSDVAAAKPDGVSDIPIAKAVPEGDGRKLVNLYFILFRAGESDWIYEKERDLIPDVLERLQNNNKDYRFRAIVLFHDNCWTKYHAGELNWYEDPDELRAMIMERDHYSHYNGYLDYDEPGSILHGLLKEQIRENPESLNYAYNCTSTHMMHSRHISRPYSIYENFAGKVVYSDIGKYYFLYEDYDETSQYPTFVEKMGGVRWICEGDMVSKVYEHLIGSLPTVTEGGEGGDMPVPSGGEGGENGEDEPEDTPENNEDQQTPYAILLLTDWNIIGLNVPIEKDGLTDTDEDGLTDWEEVDQSEITYDFLGNIKLPKLKECIDNKALDRFKESMNPMYDKIMDLFVLPILSNPGKTDSDGDDLEDLNDPVKLSYSNCSDCYINMEEKRQVDLIQDCLVWLKYLDIDETIYGKIAGLTKAAIILYQRNHRLNTGFGHFNYTAVNDETVHTGISIDIVTLYSIILDAVNHGYELDEDVLLGDYYASEVGLYFKQRYVPQAIPLEKINVSTKDDIALYIESRIMKDESADGDRIYVYDYTEPIEQMLQYGANEFHHHHYICDAFESVNDNTVKKHYIDSDKCCIRTGDDYCWLFSKVAGEKKYDIKNGERWKEFFAEIDLEVPFGHQKIPFYYKDKLLNAENLGNFLYGYVGHAADYSEDELLFGGSLYSVCDNGDKDDEEDSYWISYGYDQYNSVDIFYEYVH